MEIKDLQTRIVTPQELLNKEDTFKNYIYQLLCLDLKKENALQDLQKGIEQNGDDIIILVENSEKEIVGCLLGSKLTAGDYVTYSIGAVGENKQDIVSELRESLQKQNKSKIM